MTEPAIQAPAATAAPSPAIVAPPSPPPAIAAPPAATPPQAAPTPPAAPMEPSEGNEPAWAKARLDRAREAAQRDLLRELGVENPKDAKVALEAYRAHQESQKSELQRATERAAQLDPLTKERDSYKERLEAHTASVLAALTPEQRAAVERIAGKDPIRVSDAIEALRPTWVSQAAPLVAPTPTAVPAQPPATPATQIQAGVSTAPAGTPPPPATPVSENKLAVYEDLLAKNPMRAASYLLQNYAAIEAAKKTRS